MYIQITNRCNMSCLHCGADCGPTGTDMNLKTFEQSCKIAKSLEYEIVIGGGEPTLHKDFETFLDITLDHDLKFGLVTNGTNIKMALFLAELASEGIIWCALSLDDYHDRSMVSQVVIDAFQKDPENKTDRREIRNASKPNQTLCNCGRAVESKKLGLIDQELENLCFGEGLFVKPDGRLYHCSCQKVSYNTVFNPTYHRNYHRVRHTCSEFDKGWRNYLILPNDDDEAWFWMKQYVFYHPVK